MKPMRLYSWQHIACTPAMKRWVVRAISRGRWGKIIWNRWNYETLLMGPRSGALTRNEANTNEASFALVLDHQSTGLAPTCTIIVYEPLAIATITEALSVKSPVRWLFDLALGDRWLNSHRRDPFSIIRTIPNVSHANLAMRRWRRLPKSTW
jgi:hypothetical protein